jgi:hypothetical protein
MMLPGFQIAVDQSLPMRAIQGVGDLHGIWQRLIQRKRTLLQPGGQRLAFQKLQHQEVDAILSPDIVKCADMGVVQAGDRMSFALEALPHRRLVGEMPRQDFDRDSAA